MKALTILSLFLLQGYQWPEGYNMSGRVIEMPKREPAANQNVECKCPSRKESSRPSHLKVRDQVPSRKSKTP